MPSLVFLCASCTKSKKFLGRTTEGVIAVVVGDNPESFANPVCSSKRHTMHGVVT